MTNKEIFNFAKDNYHHFGNKFVPMTFKLLPDVKFSIDCQGDENDFFIVSEKFILYVCCEIAMGDIEKDSGTWEKVFHVTEQTSNYWNKKKYGLKKINKFITKLINDEKLG